MSDDTLRFAKHDTFRLERTLAAPPARVFRAFADPELKARWFGGQAGEYVEEIRRQDFRVGGSDRLRGRWHSGKTSDFENRYHEIVPNERIIYTYEMALDDKRISVSLATVEFVKYGDGTRLVVTEQGVFLDGYDDAGGRERGTSWLLDKLVSVIDGTPAPGALAH